jgi:hypothetical protein
MFVFKGYSFIRAVGLQNCKGKKSINELNPPGKLYLHPLQFSQQKMPGFSLNLFSIYFSSVKTIV